MIFEEDEQYEVGANLKVIGVGGCGGNALQHMIDNNIVGVEFICANTDSQDLAKSTANIKVALGKKLTNGRGAGAKPEVGREACLEEKDNLRDILQGTEMLFLTAGMGGGTGTGASPVVAEIAREMNILTVAIVTKPFEFEGSRRMKQAEQGINELAEHVDSIITVPNEKLLTELSDDISMDDAYVASDSVLKGAVQGIADLINSTGRMNVDFADVTTVMSQPGQAMMGTGEASGENRAEEAAHRAINSPLLEDINLNDAKGLLVNITASNNIGMQEYARASKAVKEIASDDATIIVGNVIDESIGDVMKVTVVATGLGSTKKSAKPKAQPKLETVSYQRTGTDDLPAQTSDKWDEYEAPTASREAEQVTSGVDYLDIPTFLREQSD